MADTITCGACGQSFHTDEEKADHIKEAHKKPRTAIEKAEDWAEIML